MSRICGEKIIILGNSIIFKETFLNYRRTGWLWTGRLCYTFFWIILSILGRDPLKTLGTKSSLFTELILSSVVALHFFHWPTRTKLSDARRKSFFSPPKYPISLLSRTSSIDLASRLAVHLYKVNFPKQQSNHRSATAWHMSNDVQM